MKKILLVLSLSLLVVLPGCKISGFNSCTITHDLNFVPLTPGAPYLIVYTFSNPLIIRNHVADSSGRISAPSHGFRCSDLRAIRVTNSNVALSVSPASVYLPTPPASGTITGQGFDATYGPPKVEYFDANGYLCGSVYATSVSSDGTSLQANLPDLTYVYSGTYQIKVTNMTYEGYYAHIVGSAYMTGWGRDRPDSDGDGWYDDEDCAPYDPSRNYDCSGCGYEAPIGYEQAPEFCANY
ncbi:MAG TPA: hypothetical protein VE262_18745 [Blastocatellia bacterium]|nr:hypothetical protein [Blastocatellia bacterium]